MKSAAIIDTLPVLGFGAKELLVKSKYAPVEESCVVCMESFAKSEDVRLLPCQHFFHMNCADQWLQVEQYRVYHLEFSFQCVTIFYQLFCRKTTHALLAKRKFTTRQSHHRHND